MGKQLVSVDRNLRRLRRSRVLAAAIFSVGGLIGCDVIGPPGEIVVDRPEVFTRERLVTRRVRETQFLEGKLNAPFVNTVQGYNDVREFSGFMAKFQATFDPLKGALDVAQGTKTLADIQRSEQMAEAQQRFNAQQINRTLTEQRQDDQIRNLQFEISRRQLIDQLLHPSTNAASTNLATFTPSSTNAAVFPANIASTTINPPPTNASNLTSLDKLNDNVSSMLSSTNRVLISPQDLVPSKAQLTASEAVRDEMAFRDFIQASLREKELDDTHDMFGYTIYTLKFDLTMMPGQFSNANYGRVAIQLLDPTTASNLSLEELRTLYQSWRISLRKTIEQEALDLQRSFRMNQLGDIELLALARHAGQLALNANQPSTRPATPSSTGAPNNIYILQSHTGGQMAVEESHLKILQQYAANVDAAHKARSEGKEDAAAIRNAREALENSIYLVVQDRYSYLTKSANHLNLIEFGEKPIRLPAELGGFSLPNLDDSAPVDDKLLKGPFRQALERLEGLMSGKTRGTARSDHRKLNKPDHILPYVYSVEPKESAQNISDVAAVEKLTDFVLSAQAALPQFGGANVGGYLNAVHDSQKRLQAILRKPIIVGFADRDENSFGWVLGPRFKIEKDGRLGFEHATVQHSVQASVAVPAWSQTLRYKTHTRWGDVEHNAGRDECEVDLPADPSALTSAFLSLLGGEKPHRPTLQPTWQEKEADRTIVLRAGDQKQFVLLRGAELWRNPTVLVGAQKADSVEVLPDMMGLLATFDHLADVPRQGTDPAHRDLTVVTSGGISTLKNIVTVLPQENGPAVQASALLTQTFVGGSDDLVILLPPGSLPKGFFELSLKLRPADAQVPDPIVLTGGQLSTAGDAITFKLSPKDPPTWWNTSREITAELFIRLTAFDNPVSLLAGGRKSFVHFSSSNEARIKLNTPKITFDATTKKPDGSLILSLPSALPLFYKAFSGLEQSLNSSTTTIILYNAGRRVASLQAKLDGTNISADPTSFPLDKLPDAGKTSILDVIVEYSGSPGKVPADSQLTIETK